MSDQLSFDDFILVSDIDRYKDAITASFNEDDYPEFSLREKDDTISIKSRHLLAATISKKKAGYYFEFKRKYLDLFSAYEVSFLKNEKCRIVFHQIDEVLSVAPQIATIIKTLSESLSGESFGCCSRFVECSNAGKCIHPDVNFASGCLYKRNLQRGLVFFGDNIKK